MAEQKFINDLSSRADAYTDQADALSLRLFHLKNMTKLAAFAAEARRTLEAFDVIAEYRPAMRSAIHAEVQYPSNWREYDDVSGDVLQRVAQQLEEVSTDMTNAMYSIVKREAA